MKLLVLLGMILLFSAPLFAQPDIGQAAHEIALPNPSGTIRKLSELKGKVVLIDFWASWCGPCRNANMKIKPVYSKYHQKGFEIFSVSLDDNVTNWKRALQQDKMSWHQVIDVNASSGSQLMQIWKLRFIPTTYLLDREGKVVAINSSKNQLEEWLKKNL